MCVFFVNERRYALNFLKSLQPCIHLVHKANLRILFQPWLVWQLTTDVTVNVLTLCPVPPLPAFYFVSKLLCLVH